MAETIRGAVQKLFPKVWRPPQVLTAELAFRCIE
jgi:hypothetical protein